MSGIINLKWKISIELYYYFKSSTKCSKIGSLGLGETDLYLKNVSQVEIMWQICRT